MLSHIRKPRLSRYRALLSYQEPDLETIKRGFIEWVEYEEYLIFRKENIYTSEKSWKAVKASKRGNDVYVWRLKKRLRQLDKLPNVKFFNSKDRSRRHKTKVAFVTLTYKRNDRLDVVWEEVSPDYNRWITGKRKKFGKIHVIKTLESQADGYVHIHCILYFEDVEFETFFYNGKWRIDRKDDIAENWHWGFVDVIALCSLRAGVGYVTKYIMKIHEALVHKENDDKHVLTLALLWIFKKRAFSISRGFKDLIVVVSVIRRKGQLDLEGNPIYRWYLVGFWAGGLGVWSKKLSYKEFFEIYTSDSFSPHLHLR